ncbi:MAG: hypothetical protein ACO3FK_07420 [Vulcanococcus sp.]
MEPGAAHAAVHLLGRHAGEERPAARFEIQLQRQLIAAHQSAGGVQQGQFAMAAALRGAAHQLEWSGGTPLKLGAPIPLLELQCGGGAPSGCWGGEGGIHGRMLLATAGSLW